MEQKELLEYIKYAAWILFGSGVFLEITPIKFSPISSFLKWLGSKLNQDVKKDIAQLTDDIKTVKTDLQGHKVESWRRDILDFASQLMGGERKTKENFDNIIHLHDKYEKYVKENNIQNGQISLAYEYIEKKFKEFRDNDGFL